MVDEKALMQARTVYNTLCEVLKERAWNFESNNEDLEVTCEVYGEDLSMRIRICVDPEKMIVSLLSYLPFYVPEDKRVDIALAVSVVNYSLIAGSFDYNYLDGSLMYRMTSCYLESLIGKDMLEYMLDVSCQTIDDYNDKYLLIIKKCMTIDDLVKLTQD